MDDAYGDVFKNFEIMKETALKILVELDVPSDKKERMVKLAELMLACIEQLSCAVMLNAQLYHTATSLLSQKQMEDFLKILAEERKRSWEFSMIESIAKRKFKVEEPNQ